MIFDAYTYDISVLDNYQTGVGISRFTQLTLEACSDHNSTEL